MSSVQAMACLPAQGGGELGPYCYQEAADVQDARLFAPIEFFYTHLHDSIRGELQTLANSVLGLESCDNLQERLWQLRERYRFLGQVYKYHSSVEDEVVYPALDSKVRNVTLAYSVEHEDEEQLFVQLSQLLSKALLEAGKQQAATVRQLACKVEEIHTTLRKHLAKEEEQLLPLLLRHFSHGEQAELVAQFLCCIPLSTVQPVLSWLKSTMPQQHQAGLQQQIAQVVSDRLLQQLLVAWLHPRADTGCSSLLEAAGLDMANEAARQLGSENLAGQGALGASAAAEPPTAGAAQPSGQPMPCGISSCDRFVCCREAPGNQALPEGGGCSRAGAGRASRSSTCRLQRDVEDGISQGRPPLWEIVYFHQAIRSALASFAEQTRALRDEQQGVVTVQQLQSLLERHRFIRAVCMFHSASEDEVVFPALRKVAAAAAAGSAGHQQPPAQQQPQEEAEARRLPRGTEARHRCEADHAEESHKFEELGRLLGDVRSCARRGAKDVGPLLADIARCAEGLARALTRHMAREEAEVLPLLARSLCHAEQRHMIWRILRAMPLRLLERVMPWVAGKMREEDVAEWLANLAGASPPEDEPLVQLITQWARRGRDLLPAPAVEGRMPAYASPGSDDPSLFSNQTCGPASFVTAASVSSGQDAALPDPSLLFGGMLIDGLAAGTAAAAAAAGYAAAAACGSSIPGAVGVQAPGAEAGAATGQRPVVARPASPAVKRAHAIASVAIRDAAAAAAVLELQPPLKRIRTDAGAEPASMGDVAAGSTQESGALQQPHQLLQQGGASAPGSLNAAAAAVAAATAETPRGGLPLSPRSTMAGSQYNPIDHIFQFHKALKRELRELETAAAAFQLAVDNHDMANIPQAIQELVARFSFLQGIYRAHSKAEDEIVFPALESKEALHNVSHAYSLDHQKEEALFEELGAVMETMRHLSDPAELDPYACQLSRMCAAVRASLETHVRAEERQLWPLFAEHFSAEEQEAIIGQIIGQTGAEVLHSMLSWVRGAMSHDELEAMLDTMKAASRSTAFEQWLDLAMSRDGASAAAAAAAVLASGSPTGEGCACGGGAAPTAAQGQVFSGQQAHMHHANGHPQPQPHHQPSHQEEMAATLAEVAQYLAKQGVAGAGAAPAPAPTDPAGIAADSSRYRPGWEDIFRMNQKQLEAAVRRVSTDQTLEPQRKAYLIQNIMASRYIVAQQRRMGSHGGSATATPTAAIAGPTAAAQAPVAPPQLPTAAAGTAALPAEPMAAAALPAVPAVRCYHDSCSSVLGCKHYKRRCQLVAPCCGEAYVCRLCHDESCDHAVDRYAVKEMVCMQCGLRQAVAGSCSQCAASMARYYCDICHLFDDEPGRDIYHCPFCNFCRQGKGLGIDSFHCMSCNACMSLELFRKHRCKEQSLKGNCPVCSDLLFESKYPVKELPCGHFMHSHCFAAYTRYSYTCPICFKSLGDMSVYWQMIDALLAAERLPPEYASKRQAVLCNDCGATGDAPFHFVYHKCSRCASYNTRVL